MNTHSESVNAEVAILREREAAMREILRVIGTSRTDPQPVFETVLKNAARLSGAPLANLCILNEARSHWTLVAHHGEGLRHLIVGQSTRLADSNLVPAVSMRTASIVHVENLIDTDLYRQGDPGRVAMVEEEGMRTILGVPLLLEGDAIGCITLFRREVKPFARDEIELVETFATQAVIAIENVRQFLEVQERLKREAASREILDIIDRSQDDGAPVFDAVLRQAATLCGSPMASLNIVDEDRKKGRLVAHWGEDLRLIEVGKTTWDLEFDRDDEFFTEVSMRDGIVRQCHDLKDTDRYRSGNRHRCEMVDVEGIRTFLAVPLIRQGQAIGNIALYRREVRPFTDDQIALVETFAAQAVIAIENVRQFREIQRKLEREVATSEVLSVISQSRDDDQRVFDALLEKAVSLSQSAHGSVWLVDDEGIWLETVARNDVNAARASGFDRRRMDATDSAVVSCVRDRAVWRMDDLQAQPGYEDDPNFPNREWMSRTGARSMLLVPLVLGDTGIGLLAMYRSEVKPYSDEHVSLIESFAAQAVIAIENTRQFKALEALNAELGDRVQSQVGELERMGRLKRFLPSAVADAVVSAGDESMLSSHRALVATLFCDMRGFTAFCESAEPEETIEVLQTYHQEMSDLIDQYGGGVDQRAGDGIMVIFNDPIPADDPAGDAVRLALAMRKKMRALCAKWKKLGHRLGFGVGISFGYATVGIVGSAGRFDYTASGTSINTAARLCDMAANDEILISPRTWAAVEGNVNAESRGEVDMKGIREPVEVFAIVAE